MEETFWKRFMISGQVMDYLYYRGLEICGRVMAKYDAQEDSDHNDLKNLSGGRMQDRGQ